MAKTAIITGGSRGIGKALSLKLGEMGYNVVINYRSESSKALSDDIAARLEKDYGVKTLVVKADVSKYEDCEALVNAAVEKFGENIDVLVNNAGMRSRSWRSIFMGMGVLLPFECDNSISHQAEQRKCV